METSEVVVKELEKEEIPPPKIDLEVLMKNLLEHASALNQMGDAEVLAATS